MKLFSCEQVSKYHPDKYADQIADAILTAYLKADRNTKVACEVLVKDDYVVLAGEITSDVELDLEKITYKVAKKLNYPVNTIVNLIGKQSKEIAKAVIKDDVICAGDQGIMTGFATRTTQSMLPFGFELANRIIKIIEDYVDHDYLSFFKGDAKVQITVDLDLPPNLSSVKTIVISVCHKEFVDSVLVTQAKVEEEMRRLLAINGINLSPYDIKLIINPGGIWTVGGPVADTGLSGRKIVCDQYGGYVSVGGGSFSGKDPSKVDRSGAYAVRKLACEMLDAYPEINWIDIQVAYLIGRAEPISLYVKSSHPELDDKILESIDLKTLEPSQIIKNLKLLEGIDYEKLAEGCHFYGNHWKKTNTSIID